MFPIEAQAEMSQAVGYMKSVTIYFDVISSASYLAWTQLPKLIAETGATVVYRPILLGGLFKAAGNRPPIDVPAKAVYMAHDFKRFADRYGVPFVNSAYLATSTAGMMRMAIGVMEQFPERFTAFVGELFRAIWVDGKDPGDQDVVTAAIMGAGLDPTIIAPLATDLAMKEKLRAHTDEAAARGAFGAPTFFVGEEMFFGQDRMDFVREALRA